MNRPALHLLRAFAVIALSAMASPALSAPGGGTTQTVILNPVTVTTVQNLDFGDMIGGTAAGTVTVNPANAARTSTGGTILAGGAPSVAIFVGVTLPNRMVHLNMPNGSITIANGTGGTMTVNNFTSDGPAIKRADGNGIVSFRVAARLNVAANQADGTYSGTFDITLNLQ